MLIHNNDKVLKYKSDPQIVYTVYATQDARDGLTLSDNMILVSNIENKQIAIGYALASLAYTRNTDVFIVETILLNDETQASRIVWQAQATCASSNTNNIVVDEFFENS